jgi:hypothetical protein
LGNTRENCPQHNPYFEALFILLSFSPAQATRPIAFIGSSLSSSTDISLDSSQEI